MPNLPGNGSAANLYAAISSVTSWVSGTRLNAPPLRGLEESNAPGKNSTHSLRHSMKLKPSWSIAASIIWRTWFGLVEVVRATNVAPAESACFIGLIGWSTAPQVSVLLLKPGGEVGEVCFFVRP